MHKRISPHGDYDQMGDAFNIIQKVKVMEVIFNCGQYNTLEKDLIKELQQKKIKYSACVKEVNVGKTKLQFLNTRVYDNENDSSSVIYMNYNSYKFLFMGDAGTVREQDLLKQYNLAKIDFLKVGHHGSNTSTSEEFIKKIMPTYAIISVGKKNRYGHPKDSVLALLYKSKIYRTDLNGSIEVKVGKDSYKIRTFEP